jgi:hypothetical protein
MHSEGTSDNGRENEKNRMTKIEIKGTTTSFVK